MGSRDSRPYSTTTAKMRLKTLSLSLLLVASCISSAAAEDEKFEILGKYKLKDGSLSKTDITLATSFGSEMQCAQVCSKADCGAFYVQTWLSTFQGGRFDMLPGTRGRFGGIQKCGQLGQC